MHTLFYFCALFEGIYKKVQFDNIGQTVKLIFADKHILNTNWLFKHVKHPNYFLNVIPELIGVTLVFHAWYTLLFFLIP